jgi:transposase
MSTRQQIATSKPQWAKKHQHISFSADEKLAIVLEALKGDISINDLCSREGINPNLLNTWTKIFLEAGKKSLSSQLEKEESSQEMENLKKENVSLKQLVAELILEVRKSKS